MAVVIAVVCAVMALVLLMVLLQARAALSSQTEALEASQAEATEQRSRANHLDDTRSQLELQLDGANDQIEALEADVAAERTHTEELSADVQRLGDALAAAEREQAAAIEELRGANDELEAAAAAIASHEAASAEHDDEVLALTRENETLQEQLITAEDEAARRSTPSVPSVLVSDDGADLDVPAFSPATAWQLELVRSERTWRYSVATNPIEDPDPFASASDPLRLAIEIEALALREDVGAFIGIDWRAGDDIDPATDPARAHLTLRLAQELLAAAAREMSPSTLVVASDPERGGLSLEVVASDPQDVDFKIPPPPIASEWIGIDEHGGMVVTVRNEPDVSSPDR